MTGNLFDRCVVVRVAKDGETHIRCRKYLWSVTCRDRETAEREALNYWMQYLTDGEYADLLNEKP